MRARSVSETHGAYRLLEQMKLARRIACVATGQRCYPNGTVQITPYLSVRIPCYGETHSLSFLAAFTVYLRRTDNSADEVSSRDQWLAWI